MKRSRLIAIALGGAAVAGLPLLYLAGEQATPAADHLDPPARTDPAVDPTPDKAADIADIYFWATDTSAIIVLTFGGPESPTLPAVYDRDVLYTLDISNAAPRTSFEHSIQIRFGRDASKPGDNFGVQLTGVPGVNGAIVGPVETNLVKDGVTVRAGLFDDPFFFDSQGLRETRNTGTLSFNNQRDFFGAKNITGVVIELPKSRLANGSNPVDLSATTARLGGQI